MQGFAPEVHSAVGPEVWRRRLIRQFMKRKCMWASFRGFIRGSVFLSFVPSCLPPGVVHSGLDLELHPGCIPCGCPLAVSIPGWFQGSAPEVHRESVFGGPCGGPFKAHPGSMRGFIRGSIRRFNRSSMRSCTRGSIRQYSKCLLKTIFLTECLLPSGHLS